MRRTSGTKSTVLLIDGEADNLAPVFAAGLGAAGHVLHVLSTQPYPLVRFSRFCQTFHSRSSECDVVARILEVANANRVTAIMACSDKGIRILAERRAELEKIAVVAGTPGVEQLKVVRDKACFAEFLAATTLPHPQSVVIRRGQWDQSDLPSYPALLKPAVGDGGIGIQRVDSISDFWRLAQEPGFADRPWVVQAFIPGRDIDVSMLCRDGEILAHTIQTPFVPGSSSFAPSESIQFVHDDAALEIARRVARTLKWTGLAHIDMRRDARDGRIFIIELNGRFWGTADGSLRAGVNFPDLACRDTIGEMFPYPVYRDGPYVVLSFARKIGWRNLTLRETTLVRHFKDPGPWLAWKLLPVLHRFLGRR